MGRWLEALQSTRHRLLWLDDTAYTERLLENGQAPWLDIGACLAWRRKALQLLNPDVAVLDVDACVGAWVSKDSNLRSLMCARSDAAAPLEAVIGTVNMQDHLREILRALRASTSKPLALVMSSPRRWMIELYRRAFSTTIDPDDDAMDDAASAVSRLLRALNTDGPDVVLLRELRVDPQMLSSWVDCYGAVFNVTRHYRWDVGLLLPGGAPRHLSGPDFTVSASGTLGIVLDESVWIGPPDVESSTIHSRSAATPVSLAVPAGPGAFLYAAIPAEADPRTVLRSLKEAR
jgi:hypothetical protein